MAEGNGNSETTLSDTPEETQPEDSTNATEETLLADLTDAQEQTQSADSTDATEGTQPTDPTDEPENMQSADPTAASDETPTDEVTEDAEAPTGETEGTEFFQTVRIDGVLITVSAGKGVMEPGAELRIISTKDGDFTRAVEENLAEDREILYLRHQVYQISGNEPNGTLQVKIENLGTVEK